MSLVEELHAAHKARLSRLGAPSPYQERYKAPLPTASPTGYPGFDVQPLYYHQMWFYDLISERKPTPAEPPKIEQIQRAIVIHFGVSKLDLLSARRGMGIARPRQIGMYLSKKLTRQSTPEIGRRFGGRDHTTVLHGIQKIKDLLTFDEQLQRDVAEIEASLR